MPSLFRKKRSKKLKLLLERKPHIARCLIPDAAFTAVPCSPIPSSPQAGTPLWRPVSAPAIHEATQVEFSPRNLPKDQSLLSYDSDNSIASDPGYATVRIPGRVVEQAEVVIETSPTGRERYPSPVLSNPRHPSPPPLSSSTLPSISPSPYSESEVDEAVTAHSRGVKDSTGAATAHSDLTPPIPVYATVIKKNKRGSPCLTSDHQDASNREPHRNKQAEKSRRRAGEAVDLKDEMAEFSETSYDSDQPDYEMQASEEEDSGHVASSPFSSRCLPPSGPHMKRGGTHSPSAVKSRRPASAGSPILLPSLAGLPVYNLQQQPQTSRDHSYLLSRTSPDGNIEYFTATPISTSASLNAPFLPSPMLQTQVGGAPSLTPNFLFSPPQTNPSSDKPVTSVPILSSPEPSVKSLSTFERVANELETVKVERNRLKAELMSFKQQYQSVKDSADMKALEQEHKLKLAKEENSALLETLGEINTIISSFPLASARGELKQKSASESFEQFSFNEESFQGIPVKLQTILKSCQLEMERLKTKCRRLITREEATNLEAKQSQEIESVERKTLERRLLGANEENFRLQENLKLERGRFATSRKEHKELVGKLSSALIKLRKERHGIQMELFALNHSHSQLESKLTHAHSLGQLSLEEHKERIRRFERQLEESTYKNSSNQHVLRNHLSYLQQKNDSLSTQLSECQGKLAVLTAKGKLQEKDIRTYRSRLERTIAERDALADLSQSHASEQFMPMSAASLRRKLALEDFSKKLDSFKQQQHLKRLLQEYPRKHQSEGTDPDEDRTTGTQQSVHISHASQPSVATKANERQGDELEWLWKASTNTPQFTSTPKPAKTEQHLTS